MATKKNDLTETVEKQAKKLLKLMGSDAQIKVNEDKTNDAILVNVETEDEKGLLIGNHGETLNSIQSALGMLVKQNVGEWKRVIVNIGDWREKQEVYLKDLAITTADRVKETGREENLYNLKPSQRRIIHLTLSEIKGIETESEGEGEDRYLIVRPSKKN